MYKQLLKLAFGLLPGFAGLTAQTNQTDSIISGGIYRKYTLYIPAIYNSAQKTPLIINMHGYGSDMQEQQSYSNFMPIADTANFLMVYPQGTTDPINGGLFWNAGISPLMVNDVQFINSLIDHLSQNYNVDPDAVYATGMSNGGFMSHTLACRLSNRIAAIASVTGSIFSTQYSSCVPGRAVPVMQIHGTADPTVAYSGNPTMEPVDTVIAFWRRNAHCNATPSFSNVPNVNTTDGCTAEHYVYSGGQNGASVELFKIIAGGHSWPGAPININVTNMDFNASVEIWRFFRKYKLQQFYSGIHEIEEFDRYTDVFPNPATSILTVKTEGAINRLELWDREGRLLKTGNDTSMDISSFEPGMYLLKVYSGHSLSVKKVIKN